MQELTKIILSNRELTPLRTFAEGGKGAALVSGLGAVHRAHLAAALRQQSGRPIFCICADETAAELLSRDLFAFLGERANLLTARELTLYAAEAASRQNEQQRLRALAKLSMGQAPVTVCTISGLLQRSIPPEILGRAVTELKMGETEIPPEAIEELLLRAGYTRTEQVEGPGQFARRGGILDFFSPAQDSPVRCEFWGDELDSMGFFDIESQRRTENIESCLILPAAEALPGMVSGGCGAVASYIEAHARAVSRRRDSAKLTETLLSDAEKLRECLSLPQADRYLELIYPEFCTAADYIDEAALVFLIDPPKIRERALAYEKQMAEDIRQQLESGGLSGKLALFHKKFEDAVSSLERFPVVMAGEFLSGEPLLTPTLLATALCRQLPSYGGSVETALSDIRHYLSGGYRVITLAADEKRAKVLCEKLRENGLAVSLDLELKQLPEKGTCVMAVGGFSGGFDYPSLGLAVLTDTQLIVSGFRKVKKQKAMKGREKLESFSDLSVGDIVVHEHHGIGRFAGVVKMPVDGVMRDYIKICYAGTDSLYVPATQLDLVTKYIGAGEDHPVKLSKMGGAEWTRTKARAKAAAKDMAKELVTLYAQRASVKGHAFAPDSPWQTEFEEAFPYQETDDQLRSVEEIKRDMESETPMDRLLCGDVGYGKTEVALRAIMKCVLDGRQAAILVPTTVLANQHYQTATQRFFGYPIRIEMLSRFRSPTQVKRAIEEIRAGSVDIVIGTHKLLQKDVVFKNLGLLVVDEEQRFGVSHKERLKEITQQVDVLTLSATPIPRTLSMALSGIRDMSTLEEPPFDRLPVQTIVMEHDWAVLIDAIQKEINRGGQVYYLHNRVESIDRTASRLAAQLEGVSVAVAHGQMGEEELSAVMERMVSGETQVLVCTTIIETGIDIPNVNTLIIEDADKLGLAQLHQLRGRVGRSSRRASAYLTFRRGKVLTEVAEKRLSAIREFAEFNSGFHIAMRDLEIRGAGNLLGAEQSGHMISVGYDMYLKLLEEAVLEERGKKPAPRTECSADLTVSAHIPESYVASADQRMDLYRRIALIRTEADADDVIDELVDRYGDLPSEVTALVHVALLRGEAARAGITEITQKGGILRFLLEDFDMRRVSELFSHKDYKGRIRVDATAKPNLNLRLVSARHIIQQARDFVAAYAGTAAENEKNS